MSALPKNGPVLKITMDAAFRTPPAFGRPMKAEIVPVNGDPPIPIGRDVTVVGRREFCDVQVDHRSLSKRHCILVKTEGLLVVRDLASTNGTKVNGQRVRWAALMPNDRVSFGGYKCRVYLGPDDVASPSERHRPAARQAAPAAAWPTTDNGFAAPSPLEVIPISADDLVEDDLLDFA